MLFESVYPLYRAVPGAETTDVIQSWPFRITVPSRPISNERGRPNKSDILEPEKGFLSNQGDITLHDLPGTFACQDQFTYDQFVEYVLKAELRFKGQGDKPIESTLPLNMQPLGTTSPIAGFKPKLCRSVFQAIRSPRCLPENASKELRLLDRVKSKMSSRTPNYAFMITVIAPTILQLHHHDPFPLKIYVTPKHGKEFSNFGEGDPYSMPPTFFRSLKLKLLGKGRYRGPAALPMGSTEENHEVEYEFAVPEDQQEALVPILMPEKSPPSFEEATGKAASDGLPAWSTLRKTQETNIDESKALDLGEMLELKAHRVRPTNPAPTFTSYNISLSYLLDYKIDLITADEDHKVEGGAPVTLLAPSEDTQAEMRADRAYRQPMRQNDIKEWSQLTGASAYYQGARNHLHRLFEIPIEDDHEGTKT